MTALVIALLTGLVQLAVQLWPNRKDRLEDEAKEEMISNEKKINDIFNNPMP